MNKLPVITMNEWLKAEEEMKQDFNDTLEEGEHTTETFAKSVVPPISVVRARYRLLELYNSGRATRRRFHNGHQGLKYAYKLCRNGTKN